ncbi:MAG: transglycosylase SLT domain-containing protein [Opitutales bacterium]
MALLLTLASGIALWHLRPVHRPLAATAIWRELQEAAKRHALDPHFVWAICHAESSLDPLADSGKARGLMQLTEPAWRQVRRDSYLRAWVWPENLEAGCAYLSWVRDQLPPEHRSHAHMAAGYRFGVGALKQAEYDVERLPSPTNLFYQQLFAGNSRPVAPPE